MCTVLVTYDKRNKMAAQALELMAMMKGVKVNYDFKAKPKMTGLDEAIEDIKMGRVTKHENFEEYQKAVYQELGYV
jgi:hypothetical protein